MATLVLMYLSVLICTESKNVLPNVLIKACFFEDVLLNVLGILIFILVHSGGLNLKIFFNRGENFLGGNQQESFILVHSGRLNLIIFFNEVKNSKIKSIKISHSGAFWRP